LMLIIITPKTRGNRSEILDENTRDEYWKGSCSLDEINMSKARKDWKLGLKLLKIQILLMEKSKIWTWQIFLVRIKAKIFAGLNFSPCTTN
jgi:hypothetical protein